MDYSHWSLTIIFQLWIKINLSLNIQKCLTVAFLSASNHLMTQFTYSTLQKINRLDLIWKETHFLIALIHRTSQMISFLFEMATIIFSKVFFDSAFLNYFFLIKDCLLPLENSQAFSVGFKWCFHSLFGSFLNCHKNLCID